MDGPAEATPAAPRIKRRRRRLLIAAPFLAVLLWAGTSYAFWMLQPTSMRFGAHSVEWVRADVPLGNQLVDEAEHLYYSWNAPKKGGPALTSLPPVGLHPPSGNLRRPVTSPALSSGWPPPITPVFPHPLPGEGVWEPTGPAVDGGSAVLVTTYRSELNYPRTVAYVGWFDHTRTAIGYYPGRYEPPHAAVRGPMMVPTGQRARLLATFNGGFTYADGHNGSTDNGRVNEPLKRGKSLAPIVWDGRINPALDQNPDSAQWGYTLGGVVRVWRTGVGIDRRGNLIYVAAPGQTVITLAKILQHVGAVRAMEFDINPEWHTFITYSAGHATQVGRNPMQSNHRYLVPDDRDFFAVYRRLPGPISVPFS